MREKLKEAHSFAYEAHIGQKRKFSDEDYIVHPEQTTLLLLDITNEEADKDLYIAALLHDVVEDTEVMLHTIEERFGSRVMSLVGELTNDKKEVKHLGKDVYLSKKINNISSSAFTIKLCDRLHNIMELNSENAPKKFKEKYIKETDFILSHLNRDLNEIQEQLINKIKDTMFFILIKGGT